MNFGFPDIVNTIVGPATVPVPYPNFAQNATMTGFAATVYVGMVNALNVGSSTPMTQGDQAGTAGPNMGRGAYTAGNPIVSVEKLPASHLCVPATGNNMICGLAAAIVPSASVVSFTQRPSEVVPDLVEAYLSAAGAPAELRREESVLVCRVRIVTADIARRLRNEVAAFGPGECTRVVLDLRGCPGGDLDGAIELLSCFVPGDTSLVRLVDVDGDVEILRARSGLPPLEVEIDVHVDGETASAAEVVVEALAASCPDRVRVHGGPTVGKRAIAAIRAGELVSIGYALSASCGG
jgi:carboxyl-terminal processing protease